jgi:hypothetical protein
MLITGRRDKLNSFAIASSLRVIGPLRRRKKWSDDHVRFRPREVAIAASLSVHPAQAEIAPTWR